MTRTCSDTDTLAGDATSAQRRGRAKALSGDVSLAPPPRVFPPTQRSSAKVGEEEGSEANPLVTPRPSAGVPTGT
eukprot:219137-Pyramimonas_sp.AAC.1